MADGDVIEIKGNCNLTVCEQRDVTGRYRKPKAAEMAHFTDASSPCEPPENPEIVIDTDQMSIEECV